MEFYTKPKEPEQDQKAQQAPKEEPYKLTQSKRVPLTAIVIGSIALLAIVGGVVGAIVLLNSNKAAKYDTAASPAPSAQQGATPSAPAGSSGSGSGSAPVVVQGGQQQGAAQQEGGQQQGAAQQQGSSSSNDSSSSSKGSASSPATSEQLQQLIDGLNRSYAAPIIVAGNTPVPGQVVITPNVVPANMNNMEIDAMKAAINYYAAAERGDYTATYGLLSQADQQKYSSAQWKLANERVDTAASNFVIFSADTVSFTNPARVKVGVTVYQPDGSSFNRYTSFIWQNGKWRHDLSAEEYSMFDNALK